LRGVGHASALSVVMPAASRCRFSARRRGCSRPGRGLVRRG
jgi:hypothetical protein